MQNLSFHESASIAREADSLCNLIERHAIPLREAHLGRTARLNGASFQLVQNGRNTIYRVRHNSRWFLKMPRSGEQDVIRREILGAETVRERIENHPSYCHAGAVRASVDSGYVLYAEIPGRPLHLALYAACFTPTTRAVRRIEQIFHGFGTVLARLHRGGVRNQTPATKEISATLRRAIMNTPKPDAVSDAIAHWVEKIPRYAPNIR